MESLCLPLIVAVTGHRELHPHDIPRVEGELRRFFTELMEAHPHTTLLLLSALGPGADRLAARVAVEMHGVDLAAVLPWPEGVADELIHRGGDRAEFDTLLAEARHVIRLPLTGSINGEALSQSSDDRQQGYAAVGRYLTRHCQVLVAIWNWQKTGQSQTRRMIHWHRKGIAAPFAAADSQLDEPETGPIRHLFARRGSCDTTAPPARLSRFGPKTQREAFFEIARNFDRFNGDAAAIGPRIARQRAAAKGWVFPGAEQEALPGHLRFVLDRFALADRLAWFWQQVNQWAFLAVLALIFIMVASFECYAHFAPDRAALLIAYPLVFCLGIGVVAALRYWRLYNRYLDNRALAEALRVHLFWKLAGLRESAADYYLRSCRTQLDWIRAALRAWTVPSGEHDHRVARVAESPPDLEILQWVKRRWMEDQQEFFTRSSERDEKSASCCRLTAWIFLGLAFTATGVQSARLLWAQWHHHPGGHDGWTHALILVVALGGVLAGLCHEYLEKRLFEKQSRSYRWMASLYRTALRRFDVLLTRGDSGRTQARELIRELGREALAENADWVIYHREHEPVMRGH